MSNIAPVTRAGGIHFSFLFFQVVSAHARKRALDIDDVKLSVQMYSEQNLTSAPSREVLLDMARTKNATPLPVPRSTCGLRLPPERHCLTARNYR